MEDLRGWVGVAFAGAGGLISGVIGAFGFAVRQDRRISRLEHSVEILAGDPARAAEFSERLTRVETSVDNHVKTVEANFSTMARSMERLEDKLDRIVTQTSRT